MAPAAEERLPRFADNFNRLLGLHRLSQHWAAQLLGVSAATMSGWTTGKATPSLASATGLARFFGISTDRLIGAEFADLLADELSDRERFQTVEARIESERAALL